MNRLTENPPWVDDLLTENWSELSHVVEADLLPYATIARPAGATTRRRAARVTVTPSAELGCGHFGCVMATRTAGIVCKITSDVSEVDFVETAWKKFGRDYPGWPEGVVRYYKVVGLTASHGDAPTFLLWRDEAWGVDRSVDLLPRTALEALKRLKFFAMNVLHHVDEAPEDLPAARRARRAPSTSALADRATHEAVGFARLGLKGPERLAVSLKAYEMTIDQLGTLPAIQDALARLLDAGMVLADVRPANIGRSAANSWVITDPGMFVSLEGRRVARGTGRDPRGSR